MTKETTNIGFAACLFELRPGTNEMQLLPIGPFRARDGRPREARAWHIDAALAARVIEQAHARATPFVIDYEHQTLASEKNGHPAPAAGWFNRLVWREGLGLFATDVEWTERARQMIRAGEYRFVSPVFAYDKTSGAIEQIVMAAITNYPAIDGMQAIAASLEIMREISDSSAPTLHSNQGELSLVQLAVCQALRVDVEDFKRTARTEFLREHAENSGLTQEELAVCRAMGVDPK